MAGPKGMGLIAEVMGPPKKMSSEFPGAKQDPDSNESEEGGEGELETHLRAAEKAKRSGDFRAYAEAFRSAVSACQGGGYGDEME